MSHIHCFIIVFKLFLMFCNDAFIWLYRSYGFVLQQINYLGYARETRFFLLSIIYKFVVSVCLGNAAFFYCDTHWAFHKLFAKV